jgi:hypothetical protein
LGKAAFDNLILDMSYKYGLVADGEGTCRLAWGRAYPSRNFREIVCHVKMLTRLAPPVHVNQFVDIRYAVLEWAAGAVAEGYSTVHAACGLAANLVRGERQIQFAEVVDSLFDGPVSDLTAFMF